MGGGRTSLPCSPKAKPFLARTWVPCQDSPGIRFTYDAHCPVPQGVDGVDECRQPHGPKQTTACTRSAWTNPSPPTSWPWLLETWSSVRWVRTHGVYATPDLIDAAEFEFSEMEDMLVAAENLYGKYAWERYDLLVLPAAFPVWRHGKPKAHLCHPHDHCGRPQLGVSGGPRARPQLERQLGHQRHVGRLLAERRVSPSTSSNASWKQCTAATSAKCWAHLSYQGLVDEVDAIMDVNPNDTHLRLALEGPRIPTMA